MSKTTRHQQEALWEFVHTELSYINKLVVIKDVILYIWSQFQSDKRVSSHPQLLLNELE